MKKILVLAGYRIALSCSCVWLVFLTGCGPKASTPEQVNQFEVAGPIGYETKPGDGAHTGLYRVIAGDILQFQMPASLRLISSEAVGSLEKVEPYLSRVSNNETIMLPIVGELHVAGKTVSEIERLVVDAYYPKYVVNRPIIVCEVAKYQSGSEQVFTIMGLVNRPNSFPYPPGVRYNLMEALAFAGGLDMVANPRYVKIYRQDAAGKILAATFEIDNKSLMDVYRITVKPGDIVYVDHTLSTRVNKFLSDVLRITVGGDYRTRND